MAQMLLRNLPDATAEAIKSQAKAHGRSAEAEAIALIDAGLAKQRQDWIAHIKRMQAEFNAHSTVPAEVVIREDRDR